jgi:hypothetical protein
MLQTIMKTKKWMRSKIMRVPHLQVKMRLKSQARNEKILMLYL